MNLRLWPWQENGALKHRPECAATYSLSLAAEAGDREACDCGLSLALEGVVYGGGAQERELITNIAKLLDIVGASPPIPCRSCSAMIRFVTTKAGRAMPITEEGKSHFADCPGAANHRARP